MTTEEIAKRVVELNRANDHKKVYEEFYSPDVVSVENWSGKREEYKGLDGIKEKGEKWEANLVEMHETTVGDPIIADNSFAVTFYMDMTSKDMGREQMTELAVYCVKDGKIVHEEFFA